MTLAELQNMFSMSMANLHNRNFGSMLL